MNTNTNWTTIDHIASPQRQSEVTKKIARELLSSVVKWNDEFTTSSGPRGTGTKWKQCLKNKFVYLTRLKDPWQQEDDWKDDISIAANETVAIFCPNWMSNSKDRARYTSINKFANEIKESTRRLWLSQKAYKWLKLVALQNLQSTTWYPARAIRIAYELFLSGSSVKFESFMNGLKKKKKKQPKINQLIIAHESMGKMGSC